MKCLQCRFENPEGTNFCGKCAAPLPSSKEFDFIQTETLRTPVKELTTGSTFAGRYQVIEELGHGGMGRVYKVLDKDLDVKIALKLIKPEISSDEETIARFRNELKVARAVTHKNVCRMYDFGKAGGTYFITMEYVPGEDLKSLVHSIGALPVGKAVAIARQTADGLAEAHRLGVVHRDLKPQNIMIDREGGARIMDFGIARSVKARGMTGAGVIIGTPEYMSPEQVEAKDVDQRSDIYSLGIILYEMTTGRLPFTADTPFAVGLKQKGEAPENPEMLNPQIPEGLSRVILKCMEKDKDKRFQDAGEVRSELERIEKDLPATARALPLKRPASSKEITVSFAPKKMVVPTLVFIALIAAGIGIWRIFLRKTSASSGGDRPSIAVLPFEDISPQKSQAHICDGMMSAVITKLNHLGKFDVPSRFLVKPFADSQKSIRTIGEELGVDNILFGAVFLDRENIRVDAELIRARDSSTLWRDSLAKNSDEIFAIQSEIAEKIAQALNVVLSPEERAGLRRKPTENIEAYKLCALGRWFFDKRTDEDFEKAIRSFQSAIDLDPNYALAYSGLADVHAFMSQSDLMSAGAKAREAAQRALALDDSLAEAHASLAEIKLEVDWDFEGAEREFKAALSLDPSYATARHWYGRFLTLILGRHEEGLAELERARDLNPTDLSVNRNLGVGYLVARRFDQAIEQLRRTYEMDPDFLQAKMVLGWAYHEKSAFQEMLDLYRDDQDDFLYLLASYRMGRSGTRETYVKLIDQAASSVDGWGAAVMYAEIGGHADKMFAHLNRAFKDHTSSLLFVKNWPSFDEYRSDPRYKALLEKMGLN